MSQNVSGAVAGGAGPAGKAGDVGGQQGSVLAGSKR
jgi:hypothetical protein